MPGEPELYLYDFELDDENEHHMLETHGVYAEDLYEVLHSDQCRVVRNEGEHEEKRPYAIIGPTNHGRWLYIPIEPTGRPGVWRPATAFDYE